MKYIIIVLAAISLLMMDCQKNTDLPKPVPELPPAAKDSYADLIGEWRLVSVRVGEEERPLSNCRRQSSITFNKDKKATDTHYTKGEADCTCRTETLTVSLTDTQLTLKGEETDTFSYTLKDDLLILNYAAKHQDGTTVTLTSTYKKGYVYNLAKELIGTWYIHHLKRDGYNADDVLEGGNCMSQEKLVITAEQLERYQYTLGSRGCKEEVFRGTYSLSEDLSAINVVSKANGVKGHIDFTLSNGVLHLTGESRLGTLEWFYQKVPKYE